MQNSVLIMLPAAAKNISIDLNMEENVFVMGEKTGIIRIWINLIENAIHYGNVGGHIWIRIMKESTKIKCVIKDDGIGIAPENQEKIFHRFFRVDKARTSEEEVHTGLGLSMVKMLVENYKGEIVVASELGHGTTFTITFPQ